MLTANPPPEEKIREVVRKLKERQPEIPEENFFLTRDESCNFVWNTVSTRSFAPLLDYYLLEKGLLQYDKKTQEEALRRLLDGIVDNPEHTVIVNGKRVPITISYLRRTDNWMSNYIAVSILESFSRHLGEQYSDIELALSPNNPWFEVTRFVLEKSTEGMGLIQQLQSLRDGPRAVYLDMPIIAAFFNQATIYELVNDIRLSARKRRIVINLYPTNFFYFASEEVGFNRAVYSVVPVLFSLKIPGFHLNPADVYIEFLDGNYNGSWQITVDYEISPIDRIRSHFNIRELQETVATLSAEVLELQRDRRALSEEAERLAEKLVKVEKARRIYQVRAARADAVARFLHQTSNLVLQPLASTMIVFEDFIEIIEDCRQEWMHTWSGEELFLELDDSLARVKETYPTASRVIDGYRELFHAFYEIYVSTKPERNVNQDLRFIDALVENKYILTKVILTLELDPNIPPLKLEGGVQSIFLELMHNAARHGARRILVKTIYDSEKRNAQIRFYNDGEPIPEAEWDNVFNQEQQENGRGFGLADARYIVETLNNGNLRLIRPDREGFSVLFIIDFYKAAQEITLPTGN